MVNHHCEEIPLVGRFEYNEFETDEEVQEEPESSDEETTTVATSPRRIRICNVHIWKYLLVQFLYLLPGLGNGFSASLPLLLTAQKASYTQQAMVSFAYWPFHMKLLWAPIVDAVYINRIGRRKTWVIPLHLISCVFLFVIPFYIQHLLETKSVGTIVAVFFTFNTVIATLDIAIDGWALKILPKEIVGYASVCNRMGYYIGLMVGVVFFILLESAEISNHLFRSEPLNVGIVTYDSFLRFWGWVWLVVFFILIFLKEDAEEEYEKDKGIIETYKLLFKIAWLPAMRILLLIVFTYSVGIAAGEAVSYLKMWEAGIPKDRLTIIISPGIPFRAFFPYIVGPRSTSPTSLKTFELCFIPSLITASLYAVIVYVTPSFIAPDGSYPRSFFLSFILIDIPHAGLTLMMVLCMMSWFNRISDPAYGGTYMTLLNTCLQLGHAMTRSAALFGVDRLTVKDCSDEKCTTKVDGYYIEIGICIGLGLLWFIIMRKKLRAVQTLPLEAWRP